MDWSLYSLVDEAALLAQLELDLLVAKPENNVPGDEADTAGVEALVEGHEAFFPKHYKAFCSITEVEVVN